MADTSGTLAPPGRIKLHEIDSSSWEHPADRAALRSLNSIPGFSEVIRKIVALLGERGIRLFFQANAVRVGPNQYGWIHERYLRVLDTMDLGWEPDLFISQTPIANAGAFGVDKPFIMINSAAVDLLEADELETILAHEVGHVASEHALYRTIVVILLLLSQRQIPIAGIAIQVALLALLEWSRKSELSCDRAALLGSQDPESSLSTLMKLAGGTEHHAEGLDLNQFLLQAEEYEEDEDVADVVFKVMNLLGATHPFHVLRVAEMRRWIREGHYDRILRGEYQRRGEEKRAYTKDAKEAASYYGGALKSAFKKLSKALDETLRGGPTEI